MIGRASNSKFHVLTGTDQLSLLIELPGRSRERSLPNVLAQSATSPRSEATVPRLLDDADKARGPVAVVLPLHFFEIVPVALSAVPDGAIDRALPYQLAKAVNRPLGEYIYDWQIVERRRDLLQLMVYLYNAAAFERMRSDLAKKHLEIRYLEPDIFAACALLEKQGKLAGEHSSLIMLIWPKNISLAVYDKKQLALVRTVAVSQPDQPWTPGGFGSIGAPGGDEPAAGAEDGELARSGAPVPPALSMEEDMPSPSDRQVEAEEISIQDWGIALEPDEPDAGDRAADRAGEAGPTGASGSGTETGGAADWNDYFQRVGLEIMRTRDYYTSVKKGRQIRQVFVGGAEEFAAELNEVNRNFLGTDLQPLFEEEPPASGRFPPLLLALAQGAGIR